MDPSLVGCFDQPAKSNSWYITSPRIFFAYILFSTTCRAFESGLVAALMGEIKDDLNMSYTMEGIVAAAPDFGIVPAGILAIFVFQYFPAHRVLVAGQFIIGLAALLAVVFRTAWWLIVARALGGLFWGFAAVHYPSWINKFGGQSDAMWLGLYNTCLLIGVLLGYGVGAAANVYDVITWRHLYGTEAVLMLVCGFMYCFMSPKMIQVTAKVRPLNLLKCCGGSLIVGGGDKRSGTWDNNNNNSYSSVSSGSNSNGTVLGSSSSSSPEIDGMKLANSSSSDLVSALGGVADSFLENGEPSPYTSFRARAGFGSQDSSGSSSGEGSDDDDDEEEGTVTGASAVRHVNRQSGQNHSSSSRGSSSSSSRGSSSGGTFSASSSSYNYSHGSNLANDESASLLSETAGHRPRHTPSSSSSSSSSTANSPHYISGKDPEKLRARKAIAQIVKSPLYLWTVTTGAVISGSVAFILYFITQVVNDLDFFGSTVTNYIVVGTVFVISPIPGTVAGAKYVQSVLGGYRNYVKGTKFMTQAAIASLLACIVLTIVALIKNVAKDHAGPIVSFFYVVAFYVYLFAGASPTATINGTAVSLMPGSSIAGSGLQFAMQNTGKLIIPAVGGMVIESLGGKVVLGFQIVLLCSCAAALFCATMAHRTALRNFPPEGMPPDSMNNGRGGSSSSPTRNSSLKGSPSSSSSSSTVPFRATATSFQGSVAVPSPPRTVATTSAIGPSSLSSKNTAYGTGPMASSSSSARVNGVARNGDDDDDDDWKDTHLTI